MHDLTTPRFLPPSSQSFLSAAGDLIVSTKEGAVTPCVSSAAASIDGFADALTVTLESIHPLIMG